MHVDTLRSEAKKQYQDAESHRQFADSLMQKAEQYERQGDTVRAQTERSSAERYLADAERCQSQGAIYEQDALAKELRASHIEKEIKDLQHDFDKKMKHLLDERDRVLH